MRASVRRLAQEMEERLRDNDYKGGWDDCTPRWLLKRLRDETKELAAAIRQDSQPTILQEAADVANFAMMIFDVVRRRR